jgi:hypothetical protein
LFAVLEIGCVNGFGERGFHVIYFSIFAPSVLCAPPPLLSELQFENGGGRVGARRRGLKTHRAIPACLAQARQNRPGKRGTGLDRFIF